MTLWIALTLLAAQPQAVPEPAPGPPSAAPPPAALTEADIEAVMERALAPTFEAFATCISDGVENAPRRGSVSTAAAAIVRGCGPQRDALMAAHADFLDNTPLSDAQKAQSHAAWAESGRTLQSQVEAALTGLRREPGDED